MARTKNEENVVETETTVVTQSESEQMQEDILSGAETDEMEATEEDIEKEPMPEQETTITEKDVNNFEEISNAYDAFLRRSVEMPSTRRGLRNAFREEEAIIGDDNNEIETTASKRKREYDILVTSAKADKPRVLYARIDGCEVVETTDSKGKVTSRNVQAVGYLIADKRADINTDREINTKMYKIIIPAAMFFTNREMEIDDANEGNFESIKREIEMRKDSVVEFVVYYLKADEINVLASRVRAMQLLSYDYYLGKKAQIKVGSKAKGYITYVNRSGIAVDVFGAEFFIPRRELAWKFVYNPLQEKKMFQVGKAVAVRIKSIETAMMEVGKIRIPYIKATGSIKDATDDPNEVLFDRYVLGQKYSAVIASVLPTGLYICNLVSEDEQKRGVVTGDCAICICDPPTVEISGPPVVGANCMVAITEKDSKKHRMRGAFTYVEG